MHVSKCCGENLEDWDAAKAERIIMKWAAANPEPRYPTWREWQAATFPDATSSMRPCALGLRCQDGATCIKCPDRPIPADIAKKLGVEPIKEVR